MTAFCRTSCPSVVRVEFVTTSTQSEGWRNTRGGKKDGHDREIIRIQSNRTRGRFRLGRPHN